MYSMAIHSVQTSVSVIMMVSVTISVSRGIKNGDCVNSWKTEREAKAENMKGLIIQFGSRKVGGGLHEDLNHDKCPQYPNRSTMNSPCCNAQAFPRPRTDFHFSLGQAHKVTCSVASAV